jgi:hypothetical protein
MEFTEVSSNELKFTYQGHNFILEVDNRGWYGRGRLIVLKSLQGFKKEYIKDVCWIKSDNYDQPPSEADVLVEGIGNWDIAKNAVIEYLNKLFN